MSYDFDGCTDRDPPKLVSDYRPDPRDLEVLVTALQLAAIELSPVTTATFTAAELFAVARSTAGEDCPIYERDLRIILPTCKFLRRLHGGRYRLR